MFRSTLFNEAKFFMDERVSRISSSPEDCKQVLAELIKIHTELTGIKLRYKPYMVSPEKFPAYYTLEWSRKFGKVAHSIEDRMLLAFSKAFVHSAQGLMARVTGGNSAAAADYYRLSYAKYRELRNFIATESQSEQLKNYKKIMNFVYRQVSSEQCYLGLYFEQVNIKPALEAYTHAIAPIPSEFLFDEDQFVHLKLRLEKIMLFRMFIINEVLPQGSKFPDIMITIPEKLEQMEQALIDISHDATLFKAEKLLEYAKQELHEVRLVSSSLNDLLHHQKKKVQPEMKSQMRPSLEISAHTVIADLHAIPDHCAITRKMLTMSYQELIATIPFSEIEIHDESKKTERISFLQLLLDGFSGSNSGLLKRESFPLSQSGELVRIDYMNSEKAYTSLISSVDTLLENQSSLQKPLSPEKINKLLKLKNFSQTLLASEYCYLGKYYQSINDIESALERFLLAIKTRLIGQTTNVTLTHLSVRLERAVYFKEMLLQMKMPLAYDASHPSVILFVKNSNILGDIFQEIFNDAARYKNTQHWEKVQKIYNQASQELSELPQRVIDYSRSHLPSGVTTNFDASIGLGIIAAASKMVQEYSTNAGALPANVDGSSSGEGVYSNSDKMAGLIIMFGLIALGYGLASCFFGPRDDKEVAPENKQENERDARQEARRNRRVAKALALKDSSAVPTELSSANIPKRVFTLTPEQLAIQNRDLKNNFEENQNAAKKALAIINQLPNDHHLYVKWNNEKRRKQLDDAMVIPFNETTYADFLKILDEVQQDNANASRYQKSTPVDSYLASQARAEFKAAAATAVEEAATEEELVAATVPVKPKLKRPAKKSSSQHVMLVLASNKPSDIKEGSGSKKKKSKPVNDPATTMGFIFTQITLIDSLCSRFHEMELKGVSDDYEKTKCFLGLFGGMERLMVLLWRYVTMTEPATAFWNKGDLAHFRTVLHKNKINVLQPSLSKVVTSAELLLKTIIENLPSLGLSKDQEDMLKEIRNLPGSRAKIAKWGDIPLFAGLNDQLPIHNECPREYILSVAKTLIPLINMFFAEIEYIPKTDKTPLFTDNFTVLKKMFGMLGAIQDDKGLNNVEDRDLVNLIKNCRVPFNGIGHDAFKTDIPRDEVFRLAKLAKKIKVNKYRCEAAIYIGVDKEQSLEYKPDATSSTSSIRLR